MRSRSARPRSVRARSQCTDQTVDVARLAEQRVDLVRRDVAVSVEPTGHHRGSGGHRFDQDDAERLPTERRGTEDVGCTESGELLVVGDATEPPDSAVVSRLRREAGGVGARARDPELRVDVESTEGLDEDAETLAFLVATAEEDRRGLARLTSNGGVRRIWSTSTPLNSTS